MANNCAGNLVAKHPPKRCDVCGRVFVPHSGRALYCPECRRRGYRWIKEQRCWRMDREVKNEKHRNL